MVESSTSSPPATDIPAESVVLPAKSDRLPLPATRTTSGLVNLFVWTTSALSVLNLLRDLTSINLYGQLAEWVQAYTRLVAAIAGPLFGWMTWRWVGVDSIDAHILVIAMMFCSALARASTEVQMADGDRRGIAMAAAWSASLLIVFLPVVILLSVLPKPVDAVVGGGVLLFMSAAFGYLFKEQDGDVPPAHIVRRELVGVLAVVVLLIAFNYTIFRP
jgi:hypothetical protein